MPFPHEWRDVEQMNTLGWLQKLSQLGAAGDLEASLVPYILAGRWNNPNTQQQSLVEMLPPPPLHNHAAVTVDRKIERVAGVSINLPSFEDLRIFRRPPKETLSDSALLTRKIDTGARGMQHIPVHEIPHIKFAAGQDITAWICFPALYYYKCQPTVSLAEVADFYLNVTRPCLTEVGMAHGEDEPVSRIQFTSIRSPQYQAIMQATTTLPSIEIQAFTAALQQRSETDKRFHKCFFVFDISPRTPWRRLDDLDAQTNDFERIEQGLAGFMDQQHPEGEQLICRLSLRFRGPGQALLWRPEAVHSIVSHLVPVAQQIVDPDLVARMIDRQPTRTLGAVTYAMCHRTTFNFTDQGTALRVVEFRSSAQGEDTRVPGFKRFGMQDTLPPALDSTVAAIIAAKSQCRRLATADAGDVEAMLAVEVDFSASRSALSRHPPLDTLFWDIKRATWWSYRSWRIHGVHLVLIQLKSTPPDARMWNEVLGLLAACVVVLNTCIRPQPDTPDTQLLLESSAYLKVPNAVNEQAAAWGDAAGAARPWINSRGAFFLAGLARNPAGEGAQAFFYRLPSSIAPAKKLLAKLYDVQALEDLGIHFGVGAHRAVVTNPREDRLYKGRTTVPVDSIMNRALGEERNFHVEGIQARKPTRLAGADVVELPDPDTVTNVGLFFDGCTLNKTLNKILRQLAYDIIQKSPNERGGTKYTTLTSQERSNVTLALYEGPELPFRAAHIVLTTHEAWDKLLAILLPDKGFVASSTSSGYATSLYHEGWVELQNRLSPGESVTVTAAMRGELGKVVWLPRGHKTGMWSSQRNLARNAIALPEDAGDLAPQIAANPRYVSSIGQLNWFHLRE